MPDSKRSLAELHQGYWDVPIAIALSTGFLVAGLFQPVITVKQILFRSDTFSVLTGIQSLWNEHQKILAVVVFVFSIVFPLIKLACLTGIWFGRYTQQTREKVLRWFDVLGKWSMLDVFVVAITIVIAKISAFADAHARPGIYVFAASIMLSIIAGMRVESVSRKTREPRRN